MPSTRATAAAVDTRRAASLSFAPPEPTARPRDIAILPAHRPLIPPAGGPGRSPTASAIGTGGQLGAMSEYPIQVEKVHAPPLRDDILARDRLLDWLHEKVNNRVTLVIAEAGYGKTTLLADFTRRTSLRVAWYRLDRGDRDWVGFLAYLVAALRVQVPDFGPDTVALLRETGSTAPPLDKVLDTFIRELADLPPDPTILILDDFHLVDDSADVLRIVNDLTQRVPRRVTFVLASRTRPRLRLARLRSQGEVSELLAPDLRFLRSELTSVLEVDTTSIGVESMAEIERRTEGWPASVQLVRSVVRERTASEVRRLVRSLSGAATPLYEYLAEEVVADLDDELQWFLMTTSILETISPDLAAAASGHSSEHLAVLIDHAARSGILMRLGDGDATARAHPLVREFLLRRLRSAVSADEIRKLHLRVATVAETRDWRVAAHHYLQAGDTEAAQDVIDANLLTILGTGAWRAAEEILSSIPASPSTASNLVIASRLALHRGEAARAVKLAERAVEMDPSSPAAAIGVMTARTFAGDAEGGVAAAAGLGDSHETGSLARAYRLALETSVDGSIDEALQATASIGIRASASRFAAVAAFNRSLLLRAQGRAEEALRAADAAIDGLESGSTDIVEVSARLTRAWALAHLGNLAQAREAAEAARTMAPNGQRVEVAGEVAELEFYYGDESRAWASLNAAGELDGEGRDQALLIKAQLHARAGDLTSATSVLSSIQPRHLSTTPAFEARRLIAYAYLAWSAGDPDAARLAAEASHLARRQGAKLWADYADVVSAASTDSADVSIAILGVGTTDPAIVSFAAEVITSRVPDLSAQALEVVEREVMKRPERWRAVLRKALTVPTTAATAANLLATIGLREEVALIHEAGRVRRDPRLAQVTRRLARQTAPTVDVLDLGRVRLRVGMTMIEGSSIRRKVLALLCFLVTKQGLSASREEVIENLWPDQEPGDGLNSLNQTAYFLRRVVEPRFQEALSPGYLRQDGETIWLDQDLVHSRAAQCVALIATLPSQPAPADAVALLERYEAPFAMDFIYEEWAARFRDPLHTSVLRVLEQGVRSAIANGDLSGATQIAERALALEPESDELQLALIKLYRATGAHAAAAERYSTYAASLQSMGLEAPSFEDLARPLG